MDTNEPLRPQPGPQHQFLANTADICIYGGSAGSGKTAALLMEACRNVDKPDYAAVILRRTSTNITGAGGIWEASQDVFPRHGGIAKQSPSLIWEFPSGAKIQFNHLQHAKNALDHRGREYALICWDEITEQLESSFWELFSRNRTTCGIRPYMRATCNPDPDSFVRRLLGDFYIGEDGYPIMERSGHIRWFKRIDDQIEWYDEPVEGAVSFSFIPARLSDNPKLLDKDPDYLNKLKALPRVEREKLLGDPERGGNWNIRPAAGTYFRREWFKMVDGPPSDPTVRIRGWDKAATEFDGRNDPDATAGVKLSITSDGTIFVEDVDWSRLTVHGVKTRMRAVAEHDGIETVQAFWQDPGQAGKVDVEMNNEIFLGFTTMKERASQKKEVYAGPFSSAVESGRVFLVRGDWNDRFIGELESFPDGKHDDQVDASSLAFMKLTTMAKRFEGSSIDWGLDALSRPNEWGAF